MRVALHTGKGGVGKTTISAATALACAGGERVGAPERSARTLLVSTDPAHSVGDVLGVPVTGDPVAVEGFANLWVAQVDTRGRFERSWSQIRGYLVGVLAARGMAEVQAEELTVLPGAEEVVALLELRRLAASGEFDVIVVDCAPTGDTLRLLALPETIGFYAQRLMGAPQRVLRSIAASLSGLPGTVPNAAVRDALGELLAELMAARDLLADPEITGMRLVLTPERVVVAEARRLYTALTLHGFHVESAIVNRVLPRHAGGEFLRRHREAQREALTQVGESFGGLVVRQVPMTPTEPVGLDLLADLARSMFAGADPLERPTAVAAIDVRGADGRYRLTMPLPLVDRGDLALARSHDDLVVTVGDVRRRVALPAVLKRCRVAGAVFENNCLLVDFEADPQLWPESLRVAAAPDEAALVSAG